MKIDKAKFIRFMKKINLAGSHSVEEVLLSFTENGLKACVVTPDSTIRVEGILKTSVFENYEAIGDVGVQELSKLLTIVNTFKSDKVEFLVEGNTLILKADKKSVEIALLDPQFIDKPTDVKEFEFKENLDVKISEIQSFIADAAINKEFSILLSTKEKQLVMKNTGKFKFTSVIDCEKALGGVQVGFGTPFINAVKNLDGALKLSISENFPCKLLEKTDDSMVNIIVAPRMNED